MKYRKSVFWFRRDLRLSDNVALTLATQQSELVVPVYVLSDWAHHHAWTGPNRQQFLCGCLESLANNLEHVGSRLILRCGSAVKELELLLRETNAEALYFNRDPDPFGKSVEKQLSILCERMGIHLISAKDVVLHEGAEILKANGDPYRVYTAYWNQWQTLEKRRPMGKVKSLGGQALLNSLNLPSLDHWKLKVVPTSLPQAGEKSARKRMLEFVEGDRLKFYATHRNLPFGNHSSGLSVDLRHGLISIRELYWRCWEVAQQGDSTVQTSVEVFLKELAWREFYMAVLHFWPEVLETEFQSQMRQVSWDSDEGWFECWKEGRTGFPIVDAGMRQLKATGWMHNRLRMIVSMFLTKDLHVHWRWGESYFMQQLVDGEIASNNGGWQWSAGTGADAAPYFRIQNPWTQSKRFDPEGKYIKTWIPELEAVPAKLLHEPPAAARGSLVKGYPLPMVDHRQEREKTLRRFRIHHG